MEVKAGLELSDRAKKDCLFWSKDEQACHHAIALDAKLEKDDLCHECPWRRIEHKKYH